MKKIGIILILFTLLGCFNNSNDVKEQVKNATDITKGDGEFVFNVKWPKKNIVQNSNIMANILPETQTIEINLNHATLQQSKSVSIVYPATSASIDNLLAGQWNIDISGKDNQNNPLNVIYDYLNIGPGVNSYTAIFGAPNIIYNTSVEGKTVYPYDNKSNVNAGDIIYVDISSFSGIQFDSVESNCNSDFVSPSSIDNNINYQLYFGTAPTSLSLQSATKNSTSSNIQLHFDYPSDFTTTVTAPNDYYYKIVASNSHGSTHSHIFKIKMYDKGIVINDYIEKYKNFAFELWKYFYFAQASTQAAISTEYVDLMDSNNSTTGGLLITADEYGRATQVEKLFSNSTNSNIQYLDYNEAQLISLHDDSNKFEALLKYDTNGNIEAVEVYEDKDGNNNIDYNTELIEKFYNINYDTNNHLQSFKYDKYSYSTNTSPSYIDVNKTYDANVTYLGDHFTSLKYYYNSSNVAEIQYDFTTTPGVVTVDYHRYSNETSDEHFRNDEKEIYTSESSVTMTID
ncbi:hypothetical protein EV215_2034 [Hypnocyclicus thermotrophus]|uniref:Uncharacterized protein n=1 Tax=Hypnocyclicus thermotrophus TaxID=1627895 RepID=A0AA46DX15_9FUSO|nr:hypothetical protein [Hypnocyclicus thermotrophus]TDT67356.1 hypothetical protein EV215_2034 [Hypnocyclicus thermotrophus]